MQSTNTFTGLRLHLLAGFDPEKIMTVPQGFGNAGTIGFSVGSIKVSNDYVTSPGSLGFNMSLGGYGSLRLPGKNHSEFVLMAGVQGTFFPLNIFGAESPPGVMIKDLPFHLIHGQYVMNAGQEVSIGLTKLGNPDYPRNQDIRHILEDRCSPYGGFTADVSWTKTLANYPPSSPPATLFGVNITAYSGALAQVPLLISNDIVGWIGQDLPGTGPSAITVAGYGVPCSGKVTMVNSTIDAGHNLAV